MSNRNLKHNELAMLHCQKYKIASMEGLGMKWYNFNIYFRLFCTIIWLLSDIGTAISDYGSLWGNSFKSDVYLIFLIIYDVSLIVGIILIRHWLFRFEKKGVRFYFIIQYLGPVILIVATLAFWGFNEDTTPQMLGRLIGSLILFALEYKYWKKRIHLFSVSKQITYVHSSDVNTREIKHCKKCGSELTYDGKYCQFCGTKNDIEKSIQESDVEEMNTNKNWIENVDFKLNNLEEKRKQNNYQRVEREFCDFCGSIVDNGAKRCSVCGKKYFKTEKFTRFSVAVIFLTATLLASVAINILQYIENTSLNDSLNYCSNHSDKLQDEVLILEQETEKQSESLDFYEKNIVIVSNDGTRKYHKYGCDDLSHSSFMAYDTVTAFQQGYRACSKCVK